MCWDGRAKAGKGEVSTKPQENCAKSKCGHRSRGRRHEGHQDAVVERGNAGMEELGETGEWSLLEG